MIDTRAQLVPARSFYFVCVMCNAKWFAKQTHCGCPRCGRSSISHEQQVLPWHHLPKPDRDVISADAAARLPNT